MKLTVLDPNTTVILRDREVTTRFLQEQADNLADFEKAFFRLRTMAMSGENGTKAEALGACQRVLRVLTREREG